MLEYDFLQKPFVDYRERPDCQMTDRFTLSPLDFRTKSNRGLIVKDFSESPVPSVFTDRKRSLIVLFMDLIREVLKNKREVVYGFHTYYTRRTSIRLTVPDQNPLEANLTKIKRIPLGLCKQKFTSFVVTL